MTIRKNVWAIFSFDEEFLNLESSLGYSETISEARRMARLEYAERWVEDWDEPRIKIMRATFELSRGYLVRAMNTYGGIVEPSHYELKEIIEISPDKARAIYEAFNGQTKEET